jgi:hypothetical protein
LDGSKYIGQWENDKQNGLGKLIKPGGIVKEGIFKDGVFKEKQDEGVNK